MAPRRSLSTSSFEPVRLRPCHCVPTARGALRRRPRAGSPAQNCRLLDAQKLAISRAFGEIAQLVEHATENCVRAAAFAPALAVFWDVSRPLERSGTPSDARGGSSGGSPDDSTMPVATQVSRPVEN